jgi:hypothetical protein
MAALTKTLPDIPFYFRTYSENGQGIVYKVVREVGPDNYMSQGSRQIGYYGDRIIWELGGYSDSMPSVAMVLSNSVKLDKAEKSKIIKDSGLDKKYNNMDGYQDEHGYWFEEKSRSRSRSRSANRANAKTRNKSRGKSKTKGK